ncbi:MAG: PIN domain-containing protein, partial [Promethearchaeota archaeon]
ASDWLRRNPKKKIVVLDSSAIMMLFEFNIDLEDELTRLLGKFQVIVPSPIFIELKYLSEQGKGKKRLIAKPSLKLIEKYEIIKTEETGDDSVLLLAKELNGIVITNDRNLRNRVKKIGLHTIYLRGKNRLVLE